MNETRAVAPFNAVELAGVNVVSVHVGAAQSVVVRAHPNAIDLITTQVRGTTLVIANPPARRLPKGPMSVSITVPSLQSLAVPTGGNGVVNLTGIRAPSFTVTVGGSGVVNASGTAARLNVSVPGAGDVNLGGLVSRDVHAAVSGAGTIFVTATRSLDASVSGEGLIRYGGSPARVTTSVTGAGVILPG